MTPSSHCRKSPQHPHKPSNTRVCAQKKWGLHSLKCKLGDNGYTYYEHQNKYIQCNSKSAVFSPIDILLLSVWYSNRSTISHRCRVKDSVLIEIPAFEMSVSDLTAPVARIHCHAWVQWFIPNEGVNLTPSFIDALIWDEPLNPCCMTMNSDHRKPADDNR